MTNFAINENRTAETALESVWKRLAETIEKATLLKRDAAEDPTLATKPEVEPYLRWLDTFRPELAQIQTIRDGASAVTTEELRTASVVGQQLLDAIDEVVQNRAAGAGELALAAQELAEPAPAAEAQQAPVERAD